MRKGFKSLKVGEATTIPSNNGPEDVQEQEEQDPWPEQPPSLFANGVAVHVEYDIENPPPVPGPEWTRFVCISDTHSKVFQVRGTECK